MAYAFEARQLMAKKKKTSKKSKSEGHRLVDLFLESASASRSGVLEGLPPPSQVKIQINCALRGRDDKPNHMMFVAALHAAASYEEDQEPAVVIQGEFALVYEFASPVGDKIADKEWMDVFAHTQCLHHCWPYWRELVQSVTSRMGLPPLRMPLLYTSKHRKQASNLK